MKRVCLVVFALVACKGGDDGNIDEPAFVPRQGFYQFEYEPWQSPDCVVYVSDRLGGMIKVLPPGDDISIKFDYTNRSHGCLVDLSDGSFECAPDTVTYDWEKEYEVDAYPSFLWGISGTFTDAEHLEGTDTVTLDCEGAFCPQVPEYNPPYPYSSVNLTFPCTLSSEYTATWVQEDEPA